MVVDASGVCFWGRGGDAESVVEVGELQPETLRKYVEGVVLWILRFLLFNRPIMLSLVGFQLDITSNGDEPLM